MESYRQEKSGEACFQTVTGISWESITWKLAPTAREESFQQRFYLYLMMTKPSKQLILSWCRTGADGKSRRPSFLIGELRTMFPNAALTDQETQADPEIYSVAEAKQRLSAKLGQYRDGQTGAG